MMENVRSVTGYPFSASLTAVPMSAGDFTTRIPAASMAFIFSAAVPLPPAMMAPAWPMRRPGGAVWPAMKPMTGLLHAEPHELRRLLLGAAADLADHHDRLGGRVLVEEREGVGVVRPDDRSPPMPMQVDWPMPRAVSWATAS